MTETWDLAGTRESTFEHPRRTSRVQFARAESERDLNEDKTKFQWTSHGRMTFKEVAGKIRKASGEIAPVRADSRKSGDWKVPEEDQVARDYLRFSPAILQKQLEDVLSQGGDIDKPLSREYCMALFLVDVSGFTNMSVHLGAEATRKHCCAFFAKIITCIMEYGGDVLKFLGDALLVGWPAALPASLETQRSLALAAAACAIEIMTKLNGYHVPQKDTKLDDIILTLHGALSIDDVYTYEVGHDDRRQFFIGGTVLGEIGAMEGEAKSGHIIMSPKFATLLPEDCGIAQSSGNLMVSMDCKINFDMSNSLISDQLAMQFHHLESDSEVYVRLTDVAKRIAKITRAHVPIACQDMISSGTFDTMGEIRWVTTIFLGLDALIPYLNSGDVEVVQKAFLAIMRCVEEAGGAIRQMVLDDKGCVVIMCWGTPGAAYGPREDAARACDCGNDLLETLHSEEFNFDHGPHMGLTAGDAYVGCIGAYRRCGYAMVGPSVNLAARLMCKTDEWQTFVDNEVYINALAAGSTWKFEPRSPVQAKGYKDPICVFRPQFSTGPMVGHADSFRRNANQAFIQKWDRLDRYAQMVGKVASVLALSPNQDDEEGSPGDLCDFNLKALVCVINDLKYGRSEQTKNAVVLLHTAGIVRCTRGTYKADPSYAFVQQVIHATVHGLFPREDVYRVHRSYAEWIADQIKAAEEQNDGGEISRARLALVHHDLDRKHLFHKELSASTPNGNSTGNWFDVLLTCCVDRRAN